MAQPLCGLPVDIRANPWLAIQNHPRLISATEGDFFLPRMNADAHGSATVWRTATDAEFIILGPNCCLLSVDIGVNPWLAITTCLENPAAPIYPWLTPRLSVIDGLLQDADMAVNIVVDPNMFAGCSAHGASERRAGEQLHHVSSHTVDVAFGDK